MKKLKNQKQLEKSSIVANSLMNRERVFVDGNSYQKELSFDIKEFLEKRLNTKTEVNWLDICSGSGKALIEAAKIFRNINITGIDLAGMFDEFDSELNSLNLFESSFEGFKLTTDFDLITCVHGLHYIGDKLEFIRRAIFSLKSDGIFLANLDLANFKTSDGKLLKHRIAKVLRQNGLEFNTRKHILIGRGKRELSFAFEYAGADDRAGANYTKQAVVDSYYV